LREAVTKSAMGTALGEALVRESLEAASEWVAPEDRAPRRFVSNVASGLRAGLRAGLGLGQIRAHSRHRSIATLMTLMLYVDEHDRQRTQTTLADLVAGAPRRKRG
jgi:hypothetical protein